MDSFTSTIVFTTAHADDIVASIPSDEDYGYGNAPAFCTIA
jgi:hypothetical protein